MTATAAPRHPSRALWLALAAGFATAAGNGAEGRPEARIFAPGVVSTGKEMAIAFSPDSRAIYFSRRLAALAKDPGKSSAVFWSQWTGDGWSEPQLTPYSGAYSTVDPAISPEGTRLYLMTTRPQTGDTALDEPDIWVARHERDGWGPSSWSEPRPLGTAVNRPSSREGAPSASERSLYFFSDREGGYGASDIYVSRLENGEHRPAENLGPSVNTASWEAHPFIARDERFLLFTTDRDDGFGKCDLYISYRQDGTWSPGANLGPTVNTADCEMLPVVSPDQENLYFTRISASGGSNVYYIPFAPLETRTNRR